MRGRQRVQILRNRLAGQGFLSIVDVMTLVVDPETRVTEAA
jgi:hypothetical protein